MNLKEILNNPVVQSFGIFDDETGEGINAKSVLTTIKKRSKAYFEKLNGYALVAPVAGKKKSETLLVNYYKKSGSITNPSFEKSGKPTDVTGLLLRFMGFDGFTLTAIAGIVGMSGVVKPDDNTVEKSLLEMMQVSGFKFIQIIPHNGETSFFGYESENSQPVKIDIWSKVGEELESIFAEAEKPGEPEIEMSTPLG